MGSEEREAESLMPRPSSRISGIVPSGKDGWEVHSAAWARKQAGEDIIMLSVGDHDFDTPTETIEACVTAVRGSNHHYTPLPAFRACARQWRRPRPPAPALRQTPTRSLPRRADRQRSTRPCKPFSTRATTPSSSRPITPPIPTPSVRRAPISPSSRPRPRTVSSRSADMIRAALRPNTRAILINTPNNPTGAVYSRQRLEAAGADLPGA